MKEFICIVCPRGCHIKVDGENITGYTCKRGLEYVKQESVAPKRTVTSTVKVKNGDLKVVSCRTTEPIDKNKMFDLMNIINKIEVEAPVKVGDVLLDNIFGTSAKLIATKEIKRI